MDQQIKNQFNSALEEFPKIIQGYLRDIPKKNGKLSGAQCAAITKLTKIEMDELMIRLLPMAKLFAIAPLSEFSVGAVAKAKAGRDGQGLFFGANIEFAGQALNQTLHAEQAAVINAWHQNATKLEAIAVSALPCGHCRQFLYEFEGSETLTVLTPKDMPHEYQAVPLVELLPKAFGPQDLNTGAILMGSNKSITNFSPVSETEDLVILKAVSAANQCYSPYTHSIAGCAIQDNNGNVFLGRYAENAAFNPSISPIQAAISFMNISNISRTQKIIRAVLVEKPSTISQKDLTESILRTFAADVTLEYYEIG